jgi:ubiquinone/menaquinone biosynthesis C-methylase UbiE
MNTPGTSYFDKSATQWDSQPERISLMKAVGEAILRESPPTPQINVLDYGCGTGLVGLFLLPHVRSVTGADSSEGMLEVLRTKVQTVGITNMKTMQLDLERQPTPPDRFHMIVSSMVMHHVADVGRVLRAFHEMLLPNGKVCIADLDSEPGLFHPDEMAAGVKHHGFDRLELQAKMKAAGFRRIRAVTAYVIQKPVKDVVRDFPVFLMAGEG